MAETTLDVKWAVSAVDNATATLEKIDKSILKLVASQEKYIKNISAASEEQKKAAKITQASAKANEEVTTSLKNIESSQNKASKSLKVLEEEQTGVLAKIRKVSDAFNEFRESLGSAFAIIKSIDFGKIARTLSIVGFALKAMGLGGFAKLLFRAAGFIEMLGKEITKIIKKVETLAEKYGSVTKAFLEVSGLQGLIDGFISLSSKIVIAGAAFTALSASSKVVQLVEDGAFALGWQLQKIPGHLSVIGVRFPKMAKVMDKGLGLITQGAFKFADKMRVTNNTIKATRDSIGGFGKGINSVGKSMLKAAGATEFFSKGMFGLIARASAVATVFGALGFTLLESESTLLKLAGGGLIALTIALGHLAFVLQRVIVMLGSFIQAIGDKLVAAMSLAIDEMIHYNSVMIKTEFIMENLNDLTHGATGSFEEWNKTMNKFSKDFRFSMDAVAQSTSELLRFGESIGLNKKQMETLLPVIGDLAKANHRDLFTSTLAVVEALNGQTVMLQNMGVNLSASAVSQRELAGENQKSFSTLTDLEKTQHRYNLLLEESKSVQDLAARTADTYEGLLKRQHLAWKALLQAMGEGANVIENRVNKQFTVLIETITGLPPAILKATGFLTAFAGRALQVIGITTKLAFSIIILSTTIRALNIALKDHYLQRFLGWLATSTLITKKLASLNTVVASTLSTALDNMSKKGLHLTSVWLVMRTAFIATGKAAWIMLLPFIKIAAIIAVIVAAFWFLFEAFKIVEAKTQTFSNAWANLVKWWEAANPVIEALTDAMSWLGDVIVRQVLVAIRETAISILMWTIIFYEAREIIEDLASSAAKTFKSIAVSVAKADVSIRQAFGDAVSWVVDQFIAMKDGAVAIIKDMFMPFIVGFQLIKEPIMTAWIFIKTFFDDISSGATKVAKWIGDAFGKAFGFLKKTLAGFSIISSAEAAEIKKTLEAEEKRVKVASRYKKEKDKIYNVIRDINGEIIKLVSGEDLALDKSKEQLRIEIEKLKIKGQYAEALKKQYEIEDKGIANASAQNKLLLGKIGGKVGLGQRQSEAVGGALAAGDAKGAIVGGLSNSQNPYLQAAAVVIEIFGKTKEEFTKWITGMVKVLAELPKQIATNIPIFIDELVKGLPAIIEGARQALPLFVDKMSELISDPAFWDRVAVAASTALADAMTRPFLITKISIAFQIAMIKAIPIIVRSFKDEIKIQFEKIFGNFGAIFTDIANKFQSAVDTFKQIVGIMTGGILGDSGTGSLSGGLLGGAVAGPFGAIAGAVGGLFENGGIIDNMYRLQRAQNGALIGGNSFTGDRTIVRANAGEMILSKEQQNNLLEMISQGGNSQPMRIETPLIIGKDRLATLLLEMDRDNYKTRIV